MSGSGEKKIPDVLRYALVAVDRVGFPVMAFLLMFYLCFVILRENTAALTRLAQSIQLLDDHVVGLKNGNFR